MNIYTMRWNGYKKSTESLRKKPSLISSIEKKSGSEAVEKKLKYITEKYSIGTSKAASIFPERTIKQAIEMTLTISPNRAS